MIDHPSQRRQRECRFVDQDIGALIQLTRKPYRLGRIVPKVAAPMLEDLQRECVKALNNLPRSTANELAQAMRLPWALRSQRLLAMSKNASHRALIQQFDIDIQPNMDIKDIKLGERWHRSSLSSSDKDAKPYLPIETDLLDALSLLDETRRLQQPTVHA